MSVPVSKEAIDKLEKIVEANEKADDWLYSSPPGEVIPVEMDNNLSSDDILKQVGDKRLPPKK